MINRNFSKETFEQVLQEKDNLIHFLKNDRSKLLNMLIKLVDFVENPKHSEDETSPEYLTDGEMLDIVIEQVRKQIKSRL